MIELEPVAHVAGVGKQKARLLAELGIVNVYDLVHYFPVRYEDRSLRPFEAFVDGANVAARVVVQGGAALRWHGKKSMCSVRLQVDARHAVLGIWFNQPYLKTKLVDGLPLLIHGKWDAARGRIVVSRTDFSGGQGSLGEAHTPIYRVVRGLTSAQLQQVMNHALSQFGQDLEDILPYQFIKKYRLLSHGDAVRAMHQPDGPERLRQAHRRLAFEEFFLFQLQLQWFRRQHYQEDDGVARPIPSDALHQFEQSLPARLTEAQHVACQEIVGDLRRPRMMSRLLQGDVGSGKTWVAFAAAFAVWRAGSQTALMAPTELLAEQHFREAQARLSPLGMHCALLTSSTLKSARDELLLRLAASEVDVVIGTHALLTEDVTFASLGLVITDEQHRFGVSQRSVLRQKGQTPDVLFLSATPIPRTLALAVYGDLDVSTIRQLPAGRKPITTRWVRHGQLEQSLLFVRRQLAAGRQAYVVAPLIEDSEELADVTSATALYEEMCTTFAGFGVALLHGRMTSRDKDEAMRQFISGQTQVLVSTTVIEVGIDVQNATVMMIYHAERFGLAQLHQLRGRVGRGVHQSYCMLVSDVTSDMAKARLEAMVNTTDGFDIAEKDLELRGPGEFLGVRQSGLPGFSVGDLTRDFKVMEVARDEARGLIENRNFWLLPAYEGLRKATRRVREDARWKD